VKRKIIPLKPRGDVERQQDTGEPVRKAEGLHAIPMQEVKRLIWMSAARAPAALRKQLIAIAERGERICPALFLLIASSGPVESKHTYRLAASLEALHLALDIHRDIAAPGDLSPKEAILCGDFYFGLALTLAGSHPLFVQGMSEAITRFAAAMINAPGQPADARDHNEYLQNLCNGGASIFALSCTLGASHGGYKPWQNEALSYYGLYLGIGLQLKREVETFRFSLRKKKLGPGAGLPLIYILEKSPLRDRLVPLLNKTMSDQEHEIFVREVNRIDLWSYTEQIIENCFSKANQFIELLRENMDSKTIQALKSFLC
jgi:geranylgeranyl pyrophosphate synthase